MARFLFPAYGMPQPREAVERTVERLQATAILETALGSLENIYPYRAPAEKPSSGRWIVVRLRPETGPTPEQISGLARARVEIVTECARTLPNPDKWHAAVHSRIALSLLDSSWTPDFLKLTVAVPVARTRPATPALYDADSDTLYASSEFSIVVSGAPLIHFLSLASGTGRLRLSAGGRLRLAN